MKEQRISTRSAVKISLRSWDTKLGSCLVPVIRQLVDRGVSARWIGARESAINNSARKTLDSFESPPAGTLSESKRSILFASSTCFANRSVKGKDANALRIWP